jgi:hypothetical protein
MDRRIWTWLGAAVISAVYVFAYSRVAWMANHGFLLTSFEIITPAVFVLSLVSQRSSAFALFVFVSLGVAAGVGVDVAMDPKPRNLFPIEILLWLIVMAPSIALGAAGGYFAHRKGVHWP